MWISREALLANSMVECRRILREFLSNYPTAPETYMMSDANMWSNTPPSNNQFITSPPTYFDQSFNPSTNYNYNQTYQSPPQPMNQFLQNSLISYQSYSQHSHHGESSQTSNYSLDDFNPTQNTPQTNYPDQSQYFSFNLPTPPNIVNHPQTNYAPQ